MRTPDDDRIEQGVKFKAGREACLEDEGIDVIFVNGESGTWGVPPPTEFGGSSEPWPKPDDINDKNPQIYQCQLPHEDPNLPFQPKWIADGFKNGSPANCGSMKGTNWKATPEFNETTLRVWSGYCLSHPFPAFVAQQG